MEFLTTFFAKIGIYTVRAFCSAILWSVSAARCVFREIRGIFSVVRRGMRWLFRELTETFRSRVRVSDELFRGIKRAKAEGKKPYISAILSFAGSFVFGENGVLYTAFNYTLPIVSIAFLIGIVRYGSGLEYGLAVEYNGRELGVILAEADIDAAERDVQQRISYSDGDEAVDLSAQYSLKIISPDDKLISAAQLADKMLAASDRELVEAYGVYVDGEFIGAVKNKTAVQEALDKNLTEYKPDGIVRDVSYAKKVEYTKGIYLAGSVRTEKQMSAKLTSKKEETHPYVVQKDENELDIVKKYGMTLEEFEELNPSVSSTDLKKGLLVNVTERERYLPIKYIRELETHTFLDYETVEVETSALSVGRRAVLEKGQLGEKTSNIEITYVDGKEQSRRVVSSEILRNPVMETIGIGTYSAMPDDPQTVYFGYPLAGSGKFGWPVNGGWVSDSFISDRNHKGMDIAAAEGTEIYAAAEGLVVTSGWNAGGYGNVVMIDHLDGFATVYAHMIMTGVEEGQYVSKGQLIGFVGNTGNSFGDHCHFEVRCQGVCLDPSSFINTADLVKS